MVLTIVTADCCREWQTRRIVYTNDLIFICMENEDIVRDSIPLSEVESVRKQTPHSSSQLFSFSKSHKSLSSVINKSLNEESGIFETKNVLTVSTKIDGYNSGRTYQFHASSEDVCNSIIAHLQKLVAGASRKRKFENSQERVAAVLNSTFVQTILAAAVVAVSP